MSPVVCDRKQGGRGNEDEAQLFSHPHHSEQNVGDGQERVFSMYYSTQSRCKTLTVRVLQLAAKGGDDVVTFEGGELVLILQPRAVFLLFRPSEHHTLHAASLDNFTLNKILLCVRHTF